MPTILLVDDDAAVRQMVDDWLSAAGYAVISVPDSVAGLRQFETHPEIDLCLVDIVMPTGSPDGAALARSIRARRPEMPVILMTGYYAAAARARDVASNLLYKPIDLDTLLSEIKRQLPN